MNTFYRKTLGTMLAAGLLLAGAFAHPAMAAAQAVPGAPGVANVSVANGNVTIVRGDSGAQVAATINAPVLPGDYVATSGGSNAEVQLDGISSLRLAPNTQVRFINLYPSSREMQLGYGTVDLSELQGADGSPQIDTPSLTVRANQAGDCRVSVLGNGQTLVTVRSGAATVSSGAGSQTITPGTTLVASGSYSSPSIGAQGAIGYDSFDQFNSSRDQSMVGAYNSNPYLAPQLAGYSNLANYGQWQNVPGYGYAWAPHNQSNFAPYQNGQWVWEPGYGYTWVGNEPWGYAPYHYGTWFNNSNYGGWLWQPPNYQPNYQTQTGTSLASSWLPALVTFFLAGGNGNGNGLNLGSLFSLLNGNGSSPYGGQIGWVPLAPGEQYQPTYGGWNPNASYPTTNVTNVTNIYNYYTNARYYRGVTMVPVSAWRAGNFRHPIIMRAQQLRRVLLIRGAIPVVPTIANLHYARATVAHRVVLARTFASPRFVAKAPVLTHVSFTRSQTQIKTIASQKPKLVAPPTHIAVVHPVYRPIVHAPIHVITIVHPVPHHITAPGKATHPTTILKPTHPATILKPTHPTTTLKPTHPTTILKPTLHPHVATPKPVVPLVIKHTPRPYVAPKPVAPLVIKHTPRPYVAPKPVAPIVIKHTPPPYVAPKPVAPIVIKHTPPPYVAPKPATPPVMVKHAPVSQPVVPKPVAHPVMPVRSPPARPVTPVKPPTHPAAAKATAHPKATPTPR